MVLSIPSFLPKVLEHDHVISRSRHSDQRARDYPGSRVRVRTFLSSQLVLYHNAEGSYLGSNRLWASVLVCDYNEILPRLFGPHLRCDCLIHLLSLRGFPPCPPRSV